MAATPYAGLSDVGRKRSRNDDRWGADPVQRLYIVADGVGSTSHGDVAAGLVVEELPKYVARFLAGVRLGDPQAVDRLGRAVVEMCNDLYVRSRNDPNLSSADTTLVAAVVAESRALVVHLGDSRAYLYRDRQVQRLTSDHTIVQAVMDAGELTPEQAAHHPNRSVVTRHVLMTPPAKPEVNAFDLRNGDRILLCSDGLHGVVDDATIAAILADQPDPAEACRVLVDAANRGGGPDNITAVVVYADHAPRPEMPVPESTFAPTLPDLAAVSMPRVAPTPPGVQPPAGVRPPAGMPPAGSPPPPPRPPRRRGGLWFALAALFAILVVAGVAAVLFWPRPSVPQTQAPQQTPAAGRSTSLHPLQPPPAPTPTALPFTELRHPEAVAVDGSGNIYVVVIDEDAARVLRLTVGSRSPSPLPFNDLREPHGVAVDGAGNVYVTDGHDKGRVLELTAGSAAPIELPFGKGHGSSLRHPAGVAVDAGGTVYVADTGNDRVVKLAPGSDVETALPLAGLQHPTGVAVGPAGEVYVIDQGRDRVVKVTPGSGPETVLPFSGLVLGAIAVDAGDIYLTDPRNHRVLKVSGMAENPTVLPFSGLDKPSGVAVDGGGVYVTDDGNGRVFKLPKL